jgi:hypothetical protein
MGSGEMLDGLQWLRDACASPVTVKNDLARPVRVSRCDRSGLRHAAVENSVWQAHEVGGVPIAANV